MDDEYKLWLTSLKVGDKVIVEKLGIIGIDIAFTHITKITPKNGIRVAYNENLLFKDGNADSGGKWPTFYQIKKITYEIVEAETRRRLINKIQNFKKWDKLSSDELQQIKFTIIDKYGEEEK